MRTECPDLDLGMPDGSVGHIHAHSFGCTECLAIEIERLGSTFPWRHGVMLRYPFGIGLTVLMLIPSI
jgi:hypothetical protein